MNFADLSDKWHHSICRYLGLDSDTYFYFGVMPGVCREVAGRRDFMYTNPQCFNSKMVYSWTEYHHKKIDDSKYVDSYYGTCPFLWEVGALASKNNYEPKGSLFFLPRDDQVTIRDSDYSKIQKIIDEAPRPATFLLPWRSCDIWKSWDKIKLGGDCRFIQMKDPVTRQFTLAEAFLQHEFVYIPWPGTDMYYSEFLNKNTIIYDDITMYRTKTSEETERDEKGSVLRFLKWGYDYLNDVQKEYFHWTEKWNDIRVQDRKFLAQKMLGLDVLKSPASLHEDLTNRGFLQHEHHYNQFKNYQYDYYTSYEWLRERVDNYKPSDYCSKIYSAL